MLTIGSLFSGIGGLELGLEWAGLGPVKWQVENNPYALKVLEKRWPSNIKTSEKSESGISNRLTSSVEDSPAKTFRSQEKEQGLRGNKAAFGLKCSGLLGRYDPATHSLRTCQIHLKLDGLSESSVTLPQSGMMRNGRLYQLKRRVLPTCENESLSWPTPQATEAQQGFQDRSRGKKGRQVSLSTAIKLWPTPRSHESGQYQRDKGQKGKERPTLTGAVKQWPTPTKHRQDMGTMLCAKFSGTSRKAGKPEAQYDPAKSGQLNPPWVEWLMGFPIGWTDLEGECEAEPRTWEHDPADNGEIPRVATGIKNRVDRLKCLGNAVVPQVAQVIGEMIKDFELRR